METQMDPHTLAVNGRRSTAFSKNIRRFRAPSLQIFLRLTDPPIFNNIGFTSVKQRFSRSRLSEKNATTIPQGYQNDLKFDPTSCQKDAAIGSTTCSKGIPENETPKLTPHHPKKDPKGARRDPQGASGALFAPTRGAASFTVTLFVGISSLRRLLRGLRAAILDPPGPPELQK